jgi:4-amino-4-deoxy-L-arabinose transferase-like glycosyltransferase
VSLATVAAWRRRQEACSEVVSPAGDQDHANGYSWPEHVHATRPDDAVAHTNGSHTNGHVAEDGGANSVDSEFTRSQQAALNAMMGFARLVEPTAQRPAGVGPQKPPGDSLAPSHGQTRNGSSPVLPLGESERLAEPDAAALLPGERLVRVPPAAKPRGDRKAAARLPARLLSRIGAGPWPLVPVLAVQACLSLRLVWSNTAYTDEALYLWAGHLEWDHVLHGTSLPAFAAYFSGSPILYPPIGALADSIGGLAGARILSLCFMLAATVLLWVTTSRLYGRRAAFFATAMWALLGPTLRLGAFATYDAMALLLLAGAACCATAHRHRDDATGWMLAGAVLLALANATKYATAIFDPIVIALAVLSAWPQPGGKLAIRRGLVLSIGTFGLLYTAFRLGGSWYAQGIKQTTLARAGGDDGAGTVIADAWLWIGLLTVTAILGLCVNISRRQDRSATLMTALLAGTALLVPLEQARIHTTISLDKHVAFGAWFAAIAAGYTISALLRLGRPAVRTVACAACVVAVPLAIAMIGFPQAQAMFRSWPDSAAFTMTFRQVVGGRTGRLLIDDPPIVQYYVGVPWPLVSTESNIRLATGRVISVPVGTYGNPKTYRRLIAEHYFTTIALPFSSAATFTSQMVAAVERTSGYRLVATPPYGTTHYGIWRYEPPQSASAGR